MSEAQVSQENPMRDILVEKVVINIGVGEPGDRLEKAVAVLERITHKKPVKTKAKKSIRDLNVRKGEEIGCKVTLRGSEAKEFIRSALLAVNNKVKASSFDDRGNLSFGIKEHIYLPGVKYDPELGIFGFDVCVRFTRRGLRVSQRGSKSSKIGKNHLVKADEARRYMVEKFGAEVI